MTALLGQAALGEHLNAARRRLFRMEALPVYAVSSDGDDFHRWLAGEAEPSMGRIQPWLDHLAAERVSGKVRRRVRLFSAELTDYERYACDWGYALTSSAGEDIRVLRTGEHYIPMTVAADDFWVIDDGEVLRMRYRPDGAFVGADVCTRPAAKMFRRAATSAWDAAEPFGQWWARHPELRRAVTV